MAVLGALSLLLTETPWSALLAAPIAFVCLLPMSLIGGLVVEASFAAWARWAPEATPRWFRILRVALALALGAAVFLAGAVVANFAFVDEPLEGSTLGGYLVSAALSVVALIAVGRSDRLLLALSDAHKPRLLMTGGLLSGAALAVLDATAFSSHYHGLHRLLAAGALGLLLLGWRAAFQWLGTERPRAATILNVTAWLLGLAFALPCFAASTRSTSVLAAVSHPTVHRRIVVAVRDSLDQDGDGYSEHLWGGDCDDEDPLAYPLSTQGDPCIAGPSTEPPPPTEHVASDAVDVAAPEVIVLVTIDAFRCGFGSDRERPELREACPELTRIGQVGRLRPDAHTVYPATAMALRGLHHASSPQGESTYLASALGELGYHSVLVASSSHAMGTLDSRGPFDETVDEVSRQLTSRSCSAPEVARVALETIERARAEHPRLFVWVHFYDPHAPYVRSSEENLVLDADLTRYVAEVRRTDEAVGQLVRGLTEMDALVLITADHGEEFGEHGGSRHGANLYETSMRIPMVAWRSGPDAQHGIPDVLPAGGDQVSDFLLAVARSQPFVSRDLVVLRVANSGHDQWGLVTQNHKLIHYRSLGYSELFDLASDPFEEADISRDSPELLVEMLTTLHREAAPLLREANR